MAELADSVLLSRSGVTRLVDRLEREGLLVRDTCVDDGRGLYAVLTDKGESLLERARPTHLAGVRERFLQHFSEEEPRRSPASGGAGAAGSVETRGSDAAGVSGRQQTRYAPTEILYRGYTQGQSRQSTDPRRWRHDHRALGASS